MAIYHYMSSFLIMSYRHQKEALDFMSQRENGPIPDDFILWKPENVDGQPW